MTIDAVRLMRETFVARVEHHSTLDSTNNRAAQCSAQGATELPLLVVSDEQTAGRGRGGNRWWTGPGSLAFSLLLDAKTVAADDTRSPLVALATAVAVIDAVTPRAPKCQVGLHWPNDVYVWPCCSPDAADERKLAGILVEVLPDRRHVVGIGVNVNNTVAAAPPELRKTVTTLRDMTGEEFNRTALLVDLLRELERQFATLRDAPEKVAQRADSLCLQRGRPMTLDSGNRKTAGLCRGIADDGAILLETPTGIEKLVSGVAI